MEYKTRDLAEAAALVTKGIRLIKLEWDLGVCWFVFIGEQIKKISEEFWSGDLLVPAKLYSEKLRSLKDRLFAQK